MLFTSAHYHVTIYDVNLEQVTNAYNNIKLELEKMEKNGILRGSISAEKQFELIKGKEIIVLIIITIILFQIAYRN